MPVVYNESIQERSITIGEREVWFDGWGFCDRVTREEAELLFTIPGFRQPDKEQLREWVELRAYAASQPDAGRYAEPVALEPEEEEAEESHEPWKLAPQEAIERWGELDLTERLRQAVDGAFTRKQLTTLFDTENRGRRSKKVLNALDQAILRATPPRGAEAINRALAKANTPVVVES